MIVKQNSNILQLLELKKILKGHKTFLWVLQTTVVTPTTFYVVEHIYIAEKLGKIPFDFILFIAIAKLAKSTSMTSC